MKKLPILICIVVTVLLINFGISLKTGLESLVKEKDDISSQNRNMQVEILKKQLLYYKSPVSLSDAFSFVINEMRYLEMNSGTLMDLTINKSKDSDDISNYYINSEYRGIKKLPVFIQVDKFSNETDMAAVLNDIYQLEVQTDFKVTEITKEGNSLNVKGDVYGI